MVKRGSHRLSHPLGGMLCGWAQGTGVCSCPAQDALPETRDELGAWLGSQLEAAGGGDPLAQRLRKRGLREGPEIRKTGETPGQLTRQEGERGLQGWEERNGAFCRESETGRES